MGINHKTGTLEPQAKRTTYKWDPQRGWLILYHYEGISQLQMRALQNDLITGQVASDMTFENGMAILEVEDSTQQFTLNTWNLDADDDNIDVFQSPLIVGAIRAAYPADNDYQAAIGQIFQSLGQEDDGPTAFANSSLTLLAGSSVQDAYTDYQSGAKEYKNDGSGLGYVLRATTNLPAYSQANLADFGVGQIYTTAQLLSEVANSALWINPLPSRLIYKIANLVPPPYRPGYQIGWFKTRSTEGSTAFNRTNLVIKYIFVQASLGLYVPYAG